MNTAETNSQSEQNQEEDNFFLPDFCNVSMVFAVVVIGELLAIVLTLAPLDRSEKRWEDLSVVSLFIQWVALLSAGVLCISRKWLSHMDDTTAATLSYLLLLSTTIVISEITYWTVQWLTLGDSLIWHIDYLISNVGICSIVSAVVLRYFYVQHQWGRNLNAKSQAQIQALHSRIRPHFLFNSLNTIASLTRIQPELAESATEDLADLFRGSLAETHHEVSLADEIELTKRYLRIERLRLGDRLKEIWNIDTVPMDALIPQLSLQPLIENAIYHGIEHLPEGGTIEIDGEINNGIITIMIKNPLSEYTRKLQRTTNRMAQENITLRLNALYGDKGKLIANDHGTHYELTFHFPYITQRNENSHN